MQLKAFADSSVIKYKIDSEKYKDLWGAENYTIDTEQLNAYNESGTFVNRNIIGDYDNLPLNKGTNTLTVSGDCTKIVANKISRWL